MFKLMHSQAGFTLMEATVAAGLTGALVFSILSFNSMFFKQQKSLELSLNTRQLIDRELRLIYKEREKIAPDEFNAIAKMVCEDMGLVADITPSYMGADPYFTCKVKQYRECANPDPDGHCLVTLTTALCDLEKRAGVGVRSACLNF